MLHTFSNNNNDIFIVIKNSSKDLNTCENCFQMLNSSRFFVFHFHLLFLFVCVFVCMFVCLFVCVFVYENVCVCVCVCLKVRKKPLNIIFVPHLFVLKCCHKVILHALFMNPFFCIVTHFQRVQLHWLTKWRSALQKCTTMWYRGSVIQFDFCWQGT